MAVVEQRSLFSWRMVEGSSEMERFRRVRDVLPDGKLIRTLRRERRRHRDDYPLEATRSASAPCFAKAGRGGECAACVECTDCRHCVSAPLAGVADARDAAQRGVARGVRV